MGHACPWNAHVLCISSFTVTPESYRRSSACHNTRLSANRCDTSNVAKMLPIFGTVCPHCEKMLLPISPFILSTPSIHQSQPAFAPATRLLLSPPHQLPSPLSHESRLSNTAFPSHICADLWLFFYEMQLRAHECIANSSDSFSEGLCSLHGCLGFWW